MTPRLAPILVAGLGNLWMSDEGIGVRLAQRLADAWSSQRDHVEVVDAGTGGLTLVHLLEGRRQAILIDCALMDEPPGVIRRFAPDAVRSRKVLTRRSLHEGDVLETLDLAARLGTAPSVIVLFGIQPAVVEPGPELSPPLIAQLDEYVAIVGREIETAINGLPAISLP